MAETRIDLELKVGLFVFIGLVLLFVVVFSIGDFYVFNPTYDLKIVYHFASGVEVSSPVRLAGVEVGEVRSIQLFHNPDTNRTEVEVLCRLRQDARVEEDAQAYIDTLGLIGEKYIQIKPGTPGTRLLEDGETLVGHDPVSTEELTEKAHKIADELSVAISALNDIIGDKEVRASLRTTIKNFEGVSSDLKEVTGQIRSGEGSVGRLVMDQTLYDEMEAFVSDIRRHPWKLLHKGKEEKAPAKQPEKKGIIQ